MTGGDPGRPFNLLKWFAISGFAAIAVISILAGLTLSHLLSEQLLKRESVVSMEFIQSIYDHLDGPSLPTGGAETWEKSKLQSFVESVTRIPDMLRANIYSVDQTVLWSSDSNLVGKKFDDNPDLATALGGELVFKHEALDRGGGARGSTKEEHEYFSGGPVEFVESYIPVRDRERTHVVAIVELYKAPLALFAAVEMGRRWILVFAAGAGLFLFAILFWVVRRGNLLITRQNEALLQSERLASIGSLARSIAHSIRNPLASIRSSAELSLEDAHDEITESINDVIRESDRLDRWIRELLVLSQSQDLDITRVTINGIVAQAVEDLTPDSGEREAGIKLDLAEGLSRAWAEPAVLRQVVVTLLTNAVEASGALEQVIVATRGKGNRLEIAVRDRGTGMDEALLRDVFTPLVSGKPDGLGLGLTLAKQAVESFGGELLLASAPGEGTVARVVLEAAD